VRPLLRKIHRLLRAPVPAPEPTLADLLGRPAVNLDTPELQRFLAGKRVMVTGAGGSIGSEICRQTMRFCPRRVILVERAENALFEIDRELRDQWVGADVRPCLADVCDERRMREVFEGERPHVVFHCAAHKHVPMMEANPREAVRNNVFGTKTVADAALAARCQAFVLVSTDKAVNPSSVMGASKRVAELYVQSLNGSGQCAVGSGQEGRGRIEDRGSRIEDSADAAAHSSILYPPSPILDSSLPTAHCPLPTSTTRFLAVRFGNVLGSSGSVVPIFRKQIDAGGPVTVTHPEMRRYFMTIPEASQLVMQAGAIGRGGEVFVLDMGSQVRILDLARELIRRSGLRPDEDIQIRFTGVRPGEKLYEELACDDEQTRPTAHPQIRAWQLPPASREQVDEGLALLSTAIDEGTPAQVVSALTECVPEYQPAAGHGVRPAATSSTPQLRLVATDSEAAVEAA
jgi:FlaA1/EpsC-like NDP-sugar epimerase